MSTVGEQIEKAADVLCEEGRVYELRALGVPEDWADGDGFTHCGYFDDRRALANAALQLDDKGAKGVYVTPNPVKPDLLARAKNRTVRSPKSTTTNGEITRRRWLLIDADPLRPAGIPSTDDELAAARSRVARVARFLKGKGFPGGVLAESGNGAHLLYRVDLPPDDGGLCKRVLQTLDARFTDEEVEVDDAVHNAARIWKLYGTAARKGDATEKRPHRRAKLLRVADPLEVVPRRKLEAVAAAEEPKAGPRNGTPSSGDSGPLAGDLAPEEVRKALGCIPPRPGYNDGWFQITAAVYDAVGGDVDAAERLLQEWSPEEEPGEYRKILNSDLDGSITFKTLIHRAQEHGYTHPAKRNGARSPKPRDAAPSGAPVAGVLASDVERKPIRWIWKGRLARGEMTILDGDPGLGKSTMLCDLAARITTGRPLPGEDKPPRSGGPGGVVLVTTEDSPSHTIRPRLDAAGADVGRVRIVQTVPTRGDDGSWDSGDERVPKLPADLDVLKATCRDVDADLLVIDPLLAHLSGEVNTFKDGDVRSALAPVQTFAEEAGLALVVVRHLTKASAGANPLYRGQASIGIIGAARLALAFGEDPENEDQLVLAPNKINLGKRPPALALRLEDSPEVPDVARVEWQGTSECSAQDLFGTQAGGDRRDQRTEEAEAFLKEVLAEGPRRSTEVHDLREERGISRNTFYGAKDNLGVTSDQEAPGRPYWMVPPWDAAPDTQPPDTQEKSLSSGQNAQNGGNTPDSVRNRGVKGPDTKKRKVCHRDPESANNGNSGGTVGEDIREGGEAIHTFTGGRVTVEKVRSQAVQITDGDGTKMTVGPNDLEPVSTEGDATANEVPF
jgi:hypothetical protein